MRRLVTIGLLLPLLPAAALAAATPPGIGVYSATALYTAVTASGGASCPSVGDNFGGPFTYAGPGKPALMYSSQLKSGNFSINRINFPKMPAAGVTSWSGTATGTSSSGGTGKATFSATFHFFDVNAFTATVLWKETSGSGACDETIEMTLTRL
jgi:hypothetical protein